MGVDPASSSTPSEVKEPRSSKRAKVVKDFGSDFITDNIKEETLTFRQAMDFSESRHWKGAVKSEIDSIISNGTWELVDLPHGCSTIGCKWIFKWKLNPNGSIVSESDKCVYYKVRGSESIVLCSYVDDILLFGTNIKIVNETKSFLKRHFEMKDMGEASVILGIKIVSTPLDLKVGLVKNSSVVHVSQLRYSQIIGSLRYLANVTRSDISYSVSKLARYTSCPNKTH
ncbi:putative mitochondrial protein AtMg00820 [Apium graveolens]|uniref:putative mitochondrial protein AtMg00820 n=1 Tax=Apium graveolens TaxID=4045 RepID=UPI003D7A5001